MTPRLGDDWPLTVADPGNRAKGRPMAGNIDSAISDLVAIDKNAMTLGIAEIILPIDQLPVFEALYDTPEFQEYAKNERYQTARFARMLASNETEREVIAMVEDAGYTMGR